VKVSVDCRHGVQIIALMRKLHACFVPSKAHVDPRMECFADRIPCGVSVAFDSQQGSIGVVVINQPTKPTEFAYLSFQ
jgi:hypothetical protein